jgi:DNA-directed RNA polymerase specialized sigma24 family protein
MVAESASSTIGPDVQAKHTTDGELSARFQSDVSALREPLYRHARRMTRGAAPTARNRAGPSEVPVDGINERDLVASAARIPAGLRSAEADVLDALPDNEIKAAMDALPECFRAAVYLAEVEGTPARRDRRHAGHPARNRHVTGVSWQETALHRPRPRRITL